MHLICGILQFSANFPTLPPLFTGMANKLLIVLVLWGYPFTRKELSKLLHESLTTNNEFQSSPV